MNSEYLVSDLLEIGTANQQILVGPGKPEETFEEVGFLQPIAEDE